MPDAPAAVLRQAAARVREYLRKRRSQAEDPLVSSEEIEARLAAAKAEVARRKIKETPNAR